GAAMPETRDAFAGRLGELGLLAASLGGACAGRGSLVLLSGEPGIGKTRTAVELAVRAEGEGAQVLWGRCHEEAGAPPYWPWSQVLRDLIAALDEDALAADLGAGAPDIAEVIPELRARLPGVGPPTPTQDPAEARFRLFASLARFLLAASRRRPRVVVLDDLHWADAPSLRFLRFIAPDLGGSGLLLLGTYRENELSRRHPLSDALGDLTRSRRTSRLLHAETTQPEARDLVSMAAGTAPAPWLVHAIHAQTEGNPLFLREIVRYLRERGLLTAVADAPRRGLPEALRIPEGVREVIGQRLTLLPPACNEVLRTASVIGRQFSLDVLLRAAGVHAPNGWVFT
ncbi:AAA family ATPase, partial [Nostoc sp. NIES-2111]